MTGHIPGTTVLRTSTVVQQAGPGSNHVALRAANERLVLSLIRAHGQLSRAQIAELSGLTAQTASVISHSLVDAGLLLAGKPVRGKVGQPSVPLSLNPDGAMFLGVHVGRGDMRAALVDFTGHVISERSGAIAEPDVDRIVRFVRDAVTKMRPAHDPDQRARFQGVGLSIANGSLGRDRARTPWLQVEEALDGVGQTLDVATYVSSEALAACSAELIYGLSSGAQNFLYVFIDESVSGGLVQDGRIRFARDDMGPNLCKILVPGADGAMTPLWSLAPLVASGSAEPEAIEQLARGIAYAVSAAVAVVPCRTVIVDGSIPIDVLQRICVTLRASLAQLGTVEAMDLSVREGSRDRKAVALGAACLPLADRFYPSETIGGRSL
ncbi:hypothetical protein LB518_03160 [Mesorhizobium sp. BR1-1-16]|nr:hypothetical protein [Mesorhizobium sp. BR1-1-16]